VGKLNIGENVSATFSNRNNVVEAVFSLAHPLAADATLSSGSLYHDLHINGLVARTGDPSSSSALNILRKLFMSLWVFDRPRLSSGNGSSRIAWACPSYGALSLASLCAVALFVAGAQSLGVLNTVLPVVFLRGLGVVAALAPFGVALFVLLIPSKGTSLGYVSVFGAVAELVFAVLFSVFESVGSLVFRVVFRHTKSLQEKAPTRTSKCARGVNFGALAAKESCYV